MESFHNVHCFNHSKITSSLYRKLFEGEKILPTETDFSKSLDHAFSALNIVINKFYFADLMSSQCCKVDTLYTKSIYSFYKSYAHWTEQIDSCRLGFYLIPMPRGNFLDNSPITVGTKHSDLIRTLMGVNFCLIEKGPLSTFNEMPITVEFMMSTAISVSICSALGYINHIRNPLCIETHKGDNDFLKFTTNI